MFFELFVVSKTANGVSDATLRNYHYHRKAISKYLDTNRPISEITKPDDFLFCDVYGGELTENALRHAVANYNKSRGVNSTSVHKFRHTFARKYLMDCGGNAFTLQKLMGHSTLNMTKRYCALYDADIARDYDMHSPLTQIKKDRERIARR